MKFTPENAADLTQILRWRRDVRHFLRDPVPEDMLNQLCTAMDFAPSVGNARPWRVLRVKSEGLRARVRAIFAAENHAAALDYAGEQAEAYAKLKLAGLDDAPVHLAVFTLQSPLEGHGLGRRTMAQTLEHSTAMAIHTLWLAARAQNLGLGMVSILDPCAIERAFDVAPDWRFSAYLCLGWPQQMDDTPLLHRTGWQENTPTTWEDV